MNKLDALIASLTAAESGRIDAMEWVPHADIRRVLEAVREDLADASSVCALRHRQSGACAAYEHIGPRCLDCPHRYHPAILAALEEQQ